MRFAMLAQRMLCGLIDLLVVMLPVQLIMMGVMQVDAVTAGYFFVLLLALYGVICIESTAGQTLGKFFGRLQVVDKDGGRPTLLYLGLRELTKAFYVLPHFGPLIALVSLGWYLLRGETLHDAAGRTRVVIARRPGKGKKEEDHAG